MTWSHSRYSNHGAWVNTCTYKQLEWETPDESWIVHSPLLCMGVAISTRIQEANIGIVTRVHSLGQSIKGLKQAD